MKLRKLIILAVAPMMCLAANAQDNTPKKGDFTVAATVGYNSYTTISAQSGNLGKDHTLESASINLADQKLMVGIEGGWFFHDLWKVTLGGGFNFSSNPDYKAVEGVYDGGNTIVPGYAYVLDQSTVQFHVYTGVDRYFDNLIKVKNLMPYAGVRLGYAYACNTAKGDPTWMGKSIGESFNIRTALTVGLDYFVTETFFMGIQVDPFAYTFNKCTLKPQEGVSNMEANSNNFSFLAAPTLKVGFKF